MPEVRGKGWEGPTWHIYMRGKKRGQLVMGGWDCVRFKPSTFSRVLPSLAQSRSLWMLKWKPLEGVKASYLVRYDSVSNAYPRPTAWRLT